MYVTQCAFRSIVQEKSPHCHLNNYRSQSTSLLERMFDISTHKDNFNATSSNARHSRF
jgi:hypothetical protein